MSEPKASEVICISVCPKDEHIAVGFENNNIAILKLTSFIENPEDYRREK